jgi:hypothetical protein
MIWGQVLIVAWLLMQLGLRSRLIAIGISLFALLPLHDGVSLAMALRGLWGDPSITTLQLLLLTFFGAMLTDIRNDWRVPALIALMGTLLYASALGSWDIDLYRFGYQPAQLLAALGALALFAWWHGRSLCLWLLAIDLCAWQTGWLESANLWDYLIDPLLLLVMLALVLRNGYRAHRKRNFNLGKP